MFIILYIMTNISNKFFANTKTLMGNFVTLGALFIAYVVLDFVQDIQNFLWVTFAVVVVFTGCVCAAIILACKKKYKAMQWLITISIFSMTALQGALIFTYGNDRYDAMYVFVFANMLFVLSFVLLIMCVLNHVGFKPKAQKVTLLITQIVLLLYWAFNLAMLISFIVSAIKYGYSHTWMMTVIINTIFGLGAGSCLTMDSIYFTDPQYLHLKHAFRRNKKQK